MKKFLSYFPGKQIFASFSDPKGLDGPPYHSLNVETLLKKNNETDKRGVFFTVNELDQSLDVAAEGSKKKHRTMKMFVRARAVWCEDDSGEMTAESFPLTPNIVVTSSPNKHHFYWLTDTTDKEAWKAIQTTMVNLYNSDPNASKDLNRVLRLPDSLHLKNEPFKVTYKVLREKPYEFAVLKTAFPPSVKEASTSTKENTSTLPENPSTADLNKAYQEGHRHGPSHRQAMKLANYGVPLEEGAAMLMQMYPEDNDAHHMQSMQSAIDKVNEEKGATMVAVKKELPSYEGRSTKKYIPEELLTDPNTVTGRLTSSLMKTWWIPNPLVAHLAVYAFGGYIMGGNYRSSLGDRVNFYQCGLGGTGSGKDLMVKGPKNILHTIFDKPEEELTKIIMKGIIEEAGSYEGLDEKMRTNGNKHDLLFCKDEMGSLFNVGRNPVAQKILDYFLRMYSDSDSTSAVRAIKSKKDDPDVANFLYAPNLILSGVTTEELMLKGLTRDMIHTGLMARIMFFNIEPYSEQPARTISKLEIDKDIKEKVIKIADTSNMDTKESLFKMPAARLHKPRIVKIDKKAEEIFYNQLCKDHLIPGDEERAVYNRRVPNAKKFAMIESTLQNPDKPVITKDIAERALIFASASCEYILDLFTERVGEGEQDLVMKRLEVRAKLYEQKHPREWIKAAWLVNDRKVKALDSYKRDQILNWMVEVEILEVTKKENHRGKTTIMYRLAL